MTAVCLKFVRNGGNCAKFGVNIFRFAAKRFRLPARLLGFT